MNKKRPKCLKTRRISCLSNERARSRLPVGRGFHSSRSTRGTGKDILTGELADELKRIAGHKVRVKATAGEKIRGFDALQVVSYNILQADDGEKPTVGKIEVIRKQPFLLVPDLGQPLALSGNRHMLEKLMEQDGAKVWIVGRMQKERLKVVKYGVLRPVDSEKCKKKRFVPPLKPMMRLDPIKKK